MTVIVDYGMGNLRSVAKACENLGYSVGIQRDLRGASRVILPGVGAFARAMENLSSIKADLISWAKDDQPLLGICLGQQLLFETSEEFGVHSGLGILGGAVKKIPKSDGLKVPHMGWSPVNIRKPDGLLSGLETGSSMYFVHSLYTDCHDKNDIAGTTKYGIEFPSSIQRGSIWATQFHPEKSGKLGLHILENFLKCS